LAIRSVNSSAFVFGQFRCDDLDRNLPAQAKIFGKVDDAHPASADLCLEPVVEEPAARAEIHGGHV
jgi:hypothetical protein